MPNGRVGGSHRDKRGQEFEYHDETDGQEAAALEDRQEWGAAARSRGADADGEQTRDEPDSNKEASACCGTGA